MTAILSTFKLDGPHQRTGLPTFTYPTHPAHTQDASSVASSSSRNPHDLPTFPPSQTEPSEPILYLPPLLSSLPHQLASHSYSYSASTSRTSLKTETHLPNIDPASLSLHKALHNFRPMNNLYAITEYAEAFNWHELRLPEYEEREWYIVVFRSKRREGSDGGELYSADKLAHEEAVKNGGVRISFLVKLMQYRTELTHSSSCTGMEYPILTQA